MNLFETPAEYLFNLEALTENEAKRTWKQRIKEAWDHSCAYCGSKEEITLDHVVAQSRGGENITSNIVPACRKCNHSKGNEHWKYWYVCQDHYNEDRLSRIEEWLVPIPDLNCFAARPKPNYRLLNRKCHYSHHRQKW